MQVGPYEAACKAKVVSTRAKFFPAPEKKIVSRAAIEKMVKHKAQRAREIKGLMRISSIEARACLEELGVLSRCDVEGKSIEEIIRTVSSHYKIRVSDLLAQGRKVVATAARQEAYYWIDQFHGKSNAQIGAIFEWRHQATICKGILAHKKRRKMLGAE